MINEFSKFIWQITILFSIFIFFDPFKISFRYYHFYLNILQIFIELCAGHFVRAGNTSINKVTLVLALKVLTVK